MSESIKETFIQILSSISVNLRIVTTCMIILSLVSLWIQTFIHFDEYDNPFVPVRVCIIVTLIVVLYFIFLF